jgi:hypothetical protein
MAAVQFHPNIAVFSAPSSFTFNTGPSSNITGGRLRVSRFHDLLGLSVVLFPAHREHDERTVKRQNIFLVFFVLSSLCNALPSFSYVCSDLVAIDLPSEVARSQPVGNFWTSDQPVTETSTCQHTTFTRDRHPCRWWVLNPQSQLVGCRRSTP